MGLVPAHRTQASASDVKAEYGISPRRYRHNLNILAHS